MDRTQYLKRALERLERVRQQQKTEEHIQDLAKMIVAKWAMGGVRFVVDTTDGTLILVTDKAETNIH